MNTSIKQISIGLMTLGFAAIADHIPTHKERTHPQDQKQYNQDQRQQKQRQQDPQNPRQQDQRPQNSQQEEELQQQYDCDNMGHSLLEVFVEDPSARIYLQGQLMNTGRSHNHSFMIPKVKFCKKHNYNVIITWGKQAQSFDLNIQANQVQQIGVR